MNIEEFKQKRIIGRKQLLKKIVETFKTTAPVAIHQFGSGTKGFNDEFSDLDIWITFKDEDIANVLQDQNKIFRIIAPVLVRHYSKSWSPSGGSANQIIHDTKFGPLQVDYYISKLSETVIPNDSQLLYGNNSIKRGAWKINSDVRDSHTLKRDINLLLSLVFISLKGIIRERESPDFVNNLKTVHQEFRKRHKNKIKRRRVNLSFKFNKTLLVDIYPIADTKQKAAINEIRNYIEQIEKLYQ